MSNAILDRTAIEDTLFGDAKVARVEGNDDPLIECFCVCSCKNSTVRDGNNALNGAGASAMMPQQ